MEMLDVQYKKEARHALALMLGYIIVFQAVASFSWRLFSSISTAMSSGIPYYLGVAAGLLVIFIGTSKIDQRAIWQQIRTIPRKPTARTIVTLLALIMLANMFFGIWSNLVEHIFQLFGLTTRAQLETASANGKDSLSMIIYVTVVAPIFEEFIFRGYLLHYFSKYSQKLAVFVTAFFFGIYHMNIAQTPFAFCLGLLLAYTALTYGLRWSIFVHFCNNAFGQVVSILAVHWGGAVNAVSSMFMLVMALGGLVFLIRHASQIKSWLQANVIPPHYLTWSLLNWPAGVAYVLCVISIVMGLDRI